VLDLKGDYYSVKASELVRKAIDELTHGMRLYVLYTMTHSATRAAIDSRHTNGVIKYHFNSPYEHKEPFRVSVATLGEYKTSVEKYWTDTGKTGKHSLDFRNHMKHIKKFRNCKDYYCPNSGDKANRTRNCTRYFYHRNYMVAGSLQEDSISSEAIAKRELVMAEYFSFDIDFYDDLPKETEQTYANFDNTRKMICKELREAALHHFESFKAIKKIFNFMFLDDRSMDKEPKEILPFLRAESKKQFVVFALWTRLSSFVNNFDNSTEKKNYDEAGAFVTVEEKQKLSHINFATVVRHEIDYDGIINGHIIKKETSFLADPFGVTHIDLTNRAMDMAHRALRRILLEDE
jgi:hypothetical protein